MNDTRTPAQEQADLLTMLAEHMRAFPHLRRFDNVDRAGRVQVSDSAHGILVWAKTVESPELSLMLVAEGKFTSIKLKGIVGGEPFQAWSADRGDISRWVDTTIRESTPITLEQLTSYVNNGTVNEAA